jgi:hypothetical protein
MSVKFGATHLNRRDLQQQKQNHFGIQFDSSFLSSDITLLVQSFPLANETTDIQEAKYFNQTIKLAGATKFDEGECVVRDAIGFDTEICLGYFVPVFHSLLMQSPHVAVQGCTIG